MFATEPKSILFLRRKGCDFMHYVISDIHGCYREYIALLKKINFSNRDYLYVLGDAVDRGPNPMDVLKDLMRRNNVTFIILQRRTKGLKYILPMGISQLTADAHMEAGWRLTVLKPDYRNM